MRSVANATQQKFHNLSKNAFIEKLSVITLGSSIVARVVHWQVIYYGEVVYPSLNRKQNASTCKLLSFFQT